MTATVAIGIESAIETGLSTVRKGHIESTPDQAAGWEALSMLDESPATAWRSTDNARDNTRALVRLGRTRNVRTFAGVEHNLSRHAVWRLTVDDEYAVRPVWTSDGVADKGDTGVGIPTSADVTIFATLALRPLPVAGNTSTMPVLRILNGAGAIRWRVGVEPSTGGSPHRLIVYCWNFTGGSVGQIGGGALDDGHLRRVAIRYRDSDRRLELFVDGSSVGSATASAGWSDTGDERLVCSWNGGSVYTAIRWQDVRIVGRYATDAEVAGYRGETQQGDERDLLASYHFTEGSGATVADTTGNANLTLTGGTWGERVSPSPRWTTGPREAWGQWSHRRSLDLAPGTYVTSPVLGAAARSVTISCALNISADAALVDGGALAWYGPTRAAAELLIETTGDGKIRAKSFRGGPHTVTSDAPVNDGVTRRCRAVLDGRNNTLDLYLAADGDAAEAAQGTQATGLDVFAAVASCKLEIGDSTAAAEATAAVADVRLCGEVRLESEDDLTRDAGVTDPELLAHARLDGSLTDQVDPSRSYASAAVAYGEIAQTATRALAAGNSRRITSAGDPFVRYPHVLVAYSPSTVEATELYLEIWDPDNPDGYISLAVALPQDALVPTFGRSYGRTRSFRRRSARRSADGIAYRERGYDADITRVELPWILTDTEADEMLARLLRQDADRLVLLITDLEAAAHRLIDHAVVGTMTAERIADPEFNRSTVEIEVEAVRKAPEI